MVQGVQKKPSCPELGVQKKPSCAEERESFKVVHRKKGKPEAYILHNGKYLLTCTARTSPGFLEHINTLKEDLASGAVLPADAKERLLGIIRET